jgi:hypothetical protein
MSSLEMRKQNLKLGFLPRVHKYEVILPGFTSISKFTCYSQYITLPSDIGPCPKGRPLGATKCLNEQRHTGDVGQLFLHSKHL